MLHFINEFFGSFTVFQNYIKSIFNVFLVLKTDKSKFRTTNQTIIKFYE